MFIINDIELLQRLSKHKILESLLRHCSLAVSAIRLNDYSFGVRQIVEAVPNIEVLQVDNNFEDWFRNKRKYLSLSDLSTIYVALINKGATMVLSEEDRFLIDEARYTKLLWLQFDDFIIKTVKDEKIIQLYNLIKVA